MKLSLQTLNGKLRFSDVTFKYPQRPTQAVMARMNFEANRGQTVALVGPSGSGKSTMISLIERFYDVDAGCVVKHLNLQQINIVTLLITDFFRPKSFFKLNCRQVGKSRSHFY